MTSIRGLVLVSSLVISGTASADTVETFTRQSVLDPRAVGIANIPTACRTYAWVPVDAYGSELEWNQLLSLAGCMQDASVSKVTDPEQLDELVEDLSEALAPSMLLYLGAIEYGPGPIRVRAAFQVGMANVALITRARSSLVAPADMRTNVESANHYRRLHADLEPLLAHAKRTAWLAFMVTDRAVAQDPTLAPDQVTRNMVDMARATLGVMRVVPREEPDR